MKETAKGLQVPNGACFKGMAGAYAAMYTPFKKDGSLNEEMIERLIEYGLSRGLRGFYLTGSTGEGFLLSLEERKRIYARAVKASAGRAKLIAHVGCIATDDAVTLARYAAKVGIDWVSSVAPVYFGQCFDAAYDHYKRISSATDLPFMIYSIGADIIPDRDLRFFDLKNVKGMKYTNYKYWTVQGLRNRLSKEVIFFAGADEQVLCGLSTGIFSGCIGTSDNIIPAHFAKICELAGNNDFAAASKLQGEVVRFVEHLIAKPNGSWHKSMMKYIGLDCGEGRPPNGRPLSAAEKKDLFARLDALGFVRRNDARR
ncbi:MAG: dihydrodipicolinate synthase family protein [Kiritimatiellae bacterium]|nr:dihydrodipicolinate synthase family protein [Kiritimatiellia bacterium]